MPTPLPPSYYCQPDWLETPKENLRQKIRRLSAAKRKRAREAFRRYQEELTRKERGNAWPQ